VPFPRKPADEWLDEDAGAPSEVASALRSLRFVNRWFGGNRVHRLLLQQAASAQGNLPARSLTVLEVAAGRAAALAAAAAALHRKGTVLHATLLDRRTSHLPKTWPPHLPAPTLLTGDALALPLPDNSVDIVSCCLFLHHLDPQQAAAFLQEAIRVSRVAVLINDLERTRTHYALARAFALVDPSRLSRHDGPVSVRQAHSAPELRALLTATGRKWQLHRRFLYRHAAILWTPLTRTNFAP
jgi:hypothetical protein